jgi:hypothetical protein
MWDQITDPAMHARVSAAVKLVFDHTDPRAVFSEPVRDGSSRCHVLYDSEGRAPDGWDLCERTGPKQGNAFRRADYFRRSDGACNAVAADSDGRTVRFSDGFGAPLEEFVSALERFAQHVASRVLRAGVPR